jgi:hypothetical protein
MKTKVTFVVLAVAGLLVFGRRVVRLFVDGASLAIDPPNESEVELTVVEKGITYKLYRAGLYRVNANSGKWEFLERLYDPDFYAKNYVEPEGAVYRKTAKGDLVSVKRRLSEDFESVKTVRDLIGLERGWTGFTLQSPKVTVHTPGSNEGASW